MRCAKIVIDKGSAPALDFLEKERYCTDSNGGEPKFPIRLEVLLVDEGVGPQAVSLFSEHTQFPLRCFP